MTHWAIKYIGLPWVSGASGPEAFDCWGLVRYVQHKHFGRALAAIQVDADNIRDVVKAFSSHVARNEWINVAKPEDGDCLLLSQSQQPTHVGIWLDIDGGGMLHSMRGAGVIFSRNDAIRALGYNILGIYRCLQR